MKRVNVNEQTIPMTLTTTKAYVSFFSTAPSDPASKIMTTLLYI